MPERSYRVVLWTLALLGVSLDQASKYGVYAWLASAEPHHSYSLFSTDGGGFELVAQHKEDADGKSVPHVNQGALFGWKGEVVLYKWRLTILKPEWSNPGFAVISLLAALAIGVWSMQSSTARDRWLCGALGLILAGTLGNLYDRIVFDGVRDFLHWNYRFDWPVFNIADCCLVCGAGLLLVQAFTSSSAATATAPTPAKAESSMKAVPQATQHS